MDELTISIKYFFECSNVKLIDLFKGYKQTITNINMFNEPVGNDELRVFTLALGGCYWESNIPKGAMVDTIMAMKMHPHLINLDLDDNHLNKHACTALANLLQLPTAKIETLRLRNTGITDEGLNELLPGIIHCPTLDLLEFENNDAITSQGWQAFAEMFKDPNCKCREISLSGTHFDNAAGIAFAEALVHNCTLDQLFMGYTMRSFTPETWMAFTKLLCNTSSINATYQSNHKLWIEILDGGYTGTLNGDNKKHVAMNKILKHHAHFDMTPFFEWEFKVLPLVIKWFEEAALCQHDMEAEDNPNYIHPCPDLLPEVEVNVERSKLSSIYQFVRAMPQLYVETGLRRELEDIKSDLARLQERKDINLVHTLDYLRKRKDGIMERLSR